LPARHSKITEKKKERKRKREGEKKNGEGKRGEKPPRPDTDVYIIEDTGEKGKES